jgi:type VI secretion system protein VasD
VKRIGCSVGAGDSTRALKPSQSKPRAALFPCTLKTAARLWQCGAALTSFLRKFMAGAQERRLDADRRHAQSPPRWIFLFWAALCSASCARSVRPPCDNPPPFYVVLQASDRLNPNDEDRSLTTQVQLLQLKGVGRFEKASFEEIWQRGKEVLAEDLVQIDDKFIDPGASLPFGVRRDSRANYVAVVANFRQPIATSWRAVVLLPVPQPDKCTPQPVEVRPVPGKEDTQLKFFLEKYQIENRTPPEKASRPAIGNRGARA